MIDIEPIAAGVREVAALFREDPEKGRNMARSVARIESGLTCHIQEGDWHLTADMSRKLGGSREGPTPGVMGRAALGSCLAIGFVMEAARAGVPISSVEVAIETDFDDGGLFGTSDAPPGYLEVRYEVRVESDASEEDLQRVADASDARSPYLDVFSRGQTVKRSLRVVSPGST